MPIVQEFRYIKPGTIAEMLSAINSTDNHVFIAGGTDVVNMFKENILKPDLVIDVKGIPECKGIRLEGGRLFVGANITFTELMESELIRAHAPVIAEASGLVASPGVRNRATLIGNICSAVPCMDSGPILRAYEAAIIVIGKNGEREIPAEQWFVAPRKTALAKDEFVKGFAVELPKTKNAGCFVKLGRYRGEDLAQVNLALLVDEKLQFRISFGSVGPVPVRALKTEKILNGFRPDEKKLAEASETAVSEIKPITDIRATKEYRTQMAKVMLKRAVNTALARLDGGGAPYGTNVLDI